MDDQFRAIVLAILGTLGSGGAVGALVKAIWNRKSEGEKRMVAWERQNQEFALKITEQLRLDLAALGEEMKETEARCQQRIDHLESSNRECEQRAFHLEGRVRDLEHRLQWNGEERRGTEDGT